MIIDERQGPGRRALSAAARAPEAPGHAGAHRRRREPADGNRLRSSASSSQSSSGSCRLFVDLHRQRARAGDRAALRRDQRRGRPSPASISSCPFVDDRHPDREPAARFREHRQIRVQVSDGKRYQVDAFPCCGSSTRSASARPSAPRCRCARDRIRTRLDAALRQAYGLRGFEAALSEDRAEMMREMRDQVRAEALARHRDRRCPHQAHRPHARGLQQTYDRMKAERLAEAEQLRAAARREACQHPRQGRPRGGRASRRGAARSRKSCAARAKASATRIFAEAFQKDPEFFAFYRSMQAYAKSLVEGRHDDGAEPDSEFFKYFGRQAQRPAAGSQSDSCRRSRLVIEGRPGGCPAWQSAWRYSRRSMISLRLGEARTLSAPSPTAHPVAPRRPIP